MYMYSPLTPEDEGLYEMTEWLKNNPIDPTTISDGSVPVPSWNKGIPADETQRNNLSKCWKGSTRSEETKEKMRLSKQGANNPNYGKFGADHPSYGTKMKITDAVLEARKIWGDIQRSNANHHTKATVLCPHCSKTGAFVAMQRWHMDNCKSKV